ncbi:cilium assembly [Mactra antiquata]
MKTNINPALVPSAAFTVVPRTPAPNPVPTSGLGGSAEILHSSLLGRPAITNQDEDPFSDPESSLYDYQVMEDAGYSSVEMLSISRKRRSMSDRNAAEIPTEHDIEEHQQAQMAQAIESPMMHQNPEALYAMPIKRGQRAPSSNTMQTTLEVRDAMQHVHDLSSDEDNGPTNRSNRRPDKKLSARSLHFPVEHETLTKEKAVHSSQSTPIHTPKSPKYQPINREEIIMQEVITPVQSSRVHTPKVNTDEPISSRSQRSITMSTEHVRNLEAEREHLTTLTHHLEKEVETYREVVSTYESGDTETAQSLLTKKEITDLKKENQSLKSSIERLNIELSAYQAKYRPIKEEEMSNIGGLPSKGPPPSWLVDPHDDHPIIKEFNIRYLNPLFLAYDDRIKEREEIIRKCQADLESLQARTESVIKENERLHVKIEQNGTGPIDNVEWAQMKDNARLILEENQNLLEQINIKDQKAHDLHQAHVREVSKLSKQLVLAKSEKSEVDVELETLQKSYKELKHKHDDMVLDYQGSMTKEQHINELADYKQKMSEVELKHKEELDLYNNKLHASQIERKTLANQTIELAAENKRLQTEVKLMHKGVKRSQQKMMILQRAIEQSETKEMSFQEYMSSLIKVAEKSAFERDTYEKVAKEHEIESKRVMKKLLHGNITVGKMEEKLKLYKMKAAARISTVAERLKEQEEMFNSQKKEYEREINHLRMLVREKEDIIQETNIEKRDIEEQMEAVWQSANSENVRIKDELKKNVTQLRKHAGLSEAIDAQDKLDSLVISSDGEGGKHSAS